MPLCDENRVLVRRGLALLRASERNGLRQVFRRKDLLGKRISTSDIAWQVSPLINSAGRMGEPGTATRVFLAESPEAAEPLVEQLFLLDGKRKSLGESAWNLVMNQARDSLERSGGRCILVHDERIQRGITGIIASRLQGFFKAPAIVMAVGTQTAVGSIRSNQNRVIADFFERHGTEFLSFGGHDFAGGFSIERGRVEGFVQAFFERAEEIPQPPAADGETITIDAEIPLTYLSPESAEDRGSFRAVRGRQPAPGVSHPRDACRALRAHRPQGPQSPEAAPGGGRHEMAGRVLERGGTIPR